MYAVQYRKQNIWLLLASYASKRNVYVIGVRMSVRRPISDSITCSVRAPDMAIPNNVLNSEIRGIPNKPLKQGISDPSLLRVTCVQIDVRGAAFGMGGKRTGFGRPVVIAANTMHLWQTDWHPSSQVRNDRLIAMPIWL
jgi:hypothetical protein